VSATIAGVGSRTVGRSGFAADRAVDLLLGGFGGLVYVFLYAPIVVVVIFAFNESREVQVWDHFGLSYWSTTWHDAEIRRAFILSVWTAAANAALATALGTAAALGLRNVGRPTRAAFDVSMYAALIVPEIVIAIASLLFFTTVGFPLGPSAIVLTHAVFNTSVVLLICRARLASMDRTLEEAGADLGAGPRERFVRVTLPQLAPAVVAGALLAFTFSFDDVVLSTFVSAPGSTTLPLKVFSQLRLGLTPGPNIVATAMLTITVTLVVTAQIVLRRAERRTTIEVPDDG
jgi:spermidine/putrescine transport system permease protein